MRSKRYKYYTVEQVRRAAHRYGLTAKGYALKFGYDKARLLIDGKRKIYYFKPTPIAVKEAP